jgi:ATP-dependent protease ClpP protease subunit
MTPHSMMLLHQPSLSLGDDVKYHLLKDEFVNMKTCMEQLVDVYKNHSFLTETQIAQILANEQSFTSADCLKYGLIEEIK